MNAPTVMAGLVGLSRPFHGFACTRTGDCPTSELYFARCGLSRFTV
jgi:hypothetical protein